MLASHSIRHAARLVQGADALIIAAGAGMSVDSGLPDFRGSNGLWSTLLPEGMRERDIGALTQGGCFTNDPVSAWRFYGRAIDVCGHATPHAGYETLLRWGQRMKHGAFVYTSNVDGHFQKAGFAESRVIECHGTMHFLQCATPCSADIWPANGREASLGDAPDMTRTELPRCIHCGGLARPNFLLFSDPGWLAARTHAQWQRFDAWRRAAERPVIVEIGAGLAVPSVRLFAESLRSPLVRINLHDAQAGDSDVALAGGARDVLMEIDAALAAFEDGPR
ncbi:Silent information regulator protein Sir2 [Burkholderia multivorans]